MFSSIVLALLSFSNLNIDHSAMLHAALLLSPDLYIFAYSAA